MTTNCRLPIIELWAGENLVRDSLAGFGTGFPTESRLVKASPAQSSQIQPPPLSLRTSPLIP